MEYSFRDSKWVLIVMGHSAVVPAAAKIEANEQENAARVFKC